jgi:hypothetical protein
LSRCDKPAAPSRRRSRNAAKQLPELYLGCVCYQTSCFGGAGAFSGGTAPMHGSTSANFVKAG